jgi:dTDP-4-dehydrorhamnose reductase
MLVTGASGLLGINFSLHAREAHSVTGVDRGRLASAPFNLIQADLLIPGTIAQAIQAARADAVVHCAALADVDLCEKEPLLARRVNVELAGEVARTCARMGVRTLQISTDAVFDGATPGQYTEADTPAPRGVYSQTKRDAELLVMSEDPAALVVRVNFYGWSVPGSRSLAEFFVNRLRAGEPVRGFTDVIFCPMFVNDLVDVLIELLLSDERGLFHVVGAQAMSKHRFGMRIAERFGLDAALISEASVEEGGLAAQRSHNLNLSVHKVSTTLGRDIPSFSTGLDRFFDQYSAGYPQQVRSYQHPSLTAAVAGPPRNRDSSGAAC